LDKEKRRHDGEEVEDSDEDIYDAEDEDEDEGKRKNLPGNDDPKLWQVRVKRNFERVAVIALLNKSIDFQRKGNPLYILSATCSDSTEGYIYVEAWKEANVREACAGLSFILNKFILVPTEEMPTIFENDKAQNNEVREY